MDKGNPALIIGLVRAILLFLTSFGFTITVGQQDAVVGLVGAIILVVISLAGTWATLHATTPVAAPVVPAGTAVTVKAPSGAVSHVTKV